MATWTALGRAWTTTAGNKTVTATPAIGDLIIVIAGASGSGTQTCAVTDDNSSGTYTASQSASRGVGPLNKLTTFYRDEFITAASSTIFTATITNDTGGGLAVFSLSGMYIAGVLARRSQNAQNNQAAGTPSLPVGTGGFGPRDPGIGYVITGSNSAANSAPPSGWTERYDQGYNNPTSGIEVVTIDSGFSGSTVDWTAATPSSFGACYEALNPDVILKQFLYPQLLPQ